MEYSQYLFVVVCGFIVWLVIAPRSGMQGYGEWFLAYMGALLLCLIGSSEIMLVKPVAFFFTVGGVFAFCYVVARSMLIIRIRK